MNGQEQAQSRSLHQLATVTSLDCQSAAIKQECGEGEIESHDSGSLKRQVERSVTIGVLLDGRIQERWVLESLNQAMAVSGIKLAAIAVARMDLHKSFSSRLHRVFDRLDQQVRCRHQHLFVPTDVVAEFEAPLLNIEIDADGNGWSPNENGVAALRRCQVDAWLCFAAIPPRRPMYPISRLGVWGIEIGQDVSAASIWGGAMEVGAGSPVTMVSVVDYAALRDSLLYRSFGATVTNSFRHNRLNAVRKGMSFFSRVLDRLTRNGDAWRTVGPVAPTPMRYPTLREPTVSAIGRLAYRLTSNVAANRMRLLNWRDQWQLAYYFADETESDCRFDRLRYLVPPKDRFWADPFAVEHQGRYFIYFEELRFRAQKGRITAIEVFENGEPGEPQVVLERPYHMSYPFVFEWEGSLYMLPETAENRKVELYRCEEFPYRWRPHQVLLENLTAYDATLWRDSDRWWMFVNLAEPGADSNDELHLFWSKTPFGPWTPHRANPVVSDVRCARPAGPLFLRDGILYRPSQDCSLAYGHSVLINRVDVLREDEYRETPMRRITPDWRKDALRVHTLGGSRRQRVTDYLVSRKQRF